MGCGASIMPPITDPQRNEMFGAAAKEMMKLSLIDAYKNKEEVVVVAPTESMEKIRSFAENLHKASAVAKEKCQDTVGGATDKVNDLAGKAADVASGAGMLGSIVGSVGAAAVGAATAVVDAGASGTGFIAEKAIKGVALAVDEAIAAIDDPFSKVGKETLAEKETEIITKYCSIIQDSVRIKDAVSICRGAAPFDQEACKKISQSACVDTMQSCCEKEILDQLRSIVQEHINNHTVVKVWDSLIEQYNKANEKLGEYEILKDFIGGPIKLDINEYIICEIAKQFHGLMCRKEESIRKGLPGTNPSKEMPRTFHWFFTGDPEYNSFTLEHYTNYRKK